MGKFRHTIVGGIYGVTFDYRVSVHRSYRPTARPSVVRPPVRISFSDDNLSKYQWIFTKLSMAIDIVEIWIGIGNGQISSVLFMTELSAHDTAKLSFTDGNWVNIQGFFSKFDTCVDNV